MTWCNSIYQVILMHRPLNCWEGELISPWARECFKRETKSVYFLFWKWYIVICFLQILPTFLVENYRIRLYFFQSFRSIFFSRKFVDRITKKHNDLWSRINEFYKSISRLLKSLRWIFIVSSLKQQFTCRYTRETLFLFQAMLLFHNIACLVWAGSRKQPTA
jgi:hypothetical protein